MKGWRTELTVWRLDRRLRGAVPRPTRFSRGRPRDCGLAVLKCVECDRERDEQPVIDIRETRLELE